MKTKSNAGFSLVELMVVVAIIGVLATIAVPNYMKFQAKAKQASAKSELAGIYTAEKAYFIESNGYHSNLPLVGYVPEGITPNGQGCPAATATNVTRYYNVGFSTHVGGDLPAGACGAVGTDANYVNRYSATINDQPLAVENGVTPAVAVNFQTFVTQARGRISGTADDVWHMDQNRVLTNIKIGI